LSETSELSFRPGAEIARLPIRHDLEGDRENCR